MVQKGSFFFCVNIVNQSKICYSIHVKKKPTRKDLIMRDVFKHTIHHDWYSSDLDMPAIGHTKQRNKYRKQQKRRARRVLKQNLRRELDF